MAWVGAGSNNSYVSSLLDIIVVEKIDIKTGPKRIDDNQNDFDYDIYKLAQIIAMNNSIKTHSNLFLAKYHLYKLLACWSFLYIFIVIIVSVHIILICR